MRKKRADSLACDRYRRKGLLQNDKVIEALNDKHKRIEVRVIEQIMFNYENYYKDIQFMASREC